MKDGAEIARVIGKGGQRLMDVQRTTGCKVSVPTRVPDADGNRFVELYGTPAQIDDAEKMILATLKTLRQPGNATHDKEPAGRRGDRKVHRNGWSTHQHRRQEERGRGRR